LHGPILEKAELRGKGQNKKDPNVNEQDKRQLKKELAAAIFSQVQGSVTHHEYKLNEKQDEKRVGHFVLLYGRHSRGLVDGQVSRRAKVLIKEHRHNAVDKLA
jgi:hypothetical protein